MQKSWTDERHTQTVLTAEEGLETEELDLLLPLDEVGCVGVGCAGAGPVHLALAEPHSVDIMPADLQDEAAVHDVQQAPGEEPLLLVGDVFGGRETQLLQADRSEQLLLVHHGPQVPVEQPAALGVTHYQRGARLLPAELELHLQVRHCPRTMRRGSAFHIYIRRSSVCGSSFLTKLFVNRKHSVFLTR